MCHYQGEIELQETHVSLLCVLIKGRWDIYKKYTTKIQYIKDIFNWDVHSCDIKPNLRLNAS